MTQETSGYLHATIDRLQKALDAVVELHKPTHYGDCSHCYGLHDMGETYPCPTIQAIEKHLGEATPPSEKQRSKDEFLPLSSE